MRVGRPNQGHQRMVVKGVLLASVEWFGDPLAIIDFH